MSWLVEYFIEGGRACGDISKYKRWLENKLDKSQKKNKKLKEYTQHKGDCECIQGKFGKDGFWHDSKKCTCGFNKLLKENK